MRHSGKRPRTSLNTGLEHIFFGAAYPTIPSRCISGNQKSKNCSRPKSNTRVVTQPSGSERLNIKGLKSEPHLSLSGGGWRTHLKVVAAADVFLVDPDLWDGGAVRRKARHRLPHLRPTRLLGTAKTTRQTRKSREPHASGFSSIFTTLCTQQEGRLQRGGGLLTCCLPHKFDHRPHVPTVAGEPFLLLVGTCPAVERSVSFFCSKGRGDVIGHGMVCMVRSERCRKTRETTPYPPSDEIHS